MNLLPHIEYITCGNNLIFGMVFVKGVDEQFPEGTLPFR